MSTGSSPKPKVVYPRQRTEFTTRQNTALRAKAWTVSISAAAGEPSDPIYPLYWSAKWDDVSGVQ